MKKSWKKPELVVLSRDERDGSTVSQWTAGPVPGPASDQWTAGPVPAPLDQWAAGPIPPLPN